MIFFTDSLLSLQDQLRDHLEGDIVCLDVKKVNVHSLLVLLSLGRLII